LPAALESRDDWEDTEILLPPEYGTARQKWRDVVTNATLEPGLEGFSPGNIFRDLPVAVLACEG
jgi:hypothetical protein